MIHGIPVYEYLELTDGGLFAIGHGTSSERPTMLTSVTEPDPAPDWFGEPEQFRLGVDLSGERVSPPDRI